MVRAATLIVCLFLLGCAQAGPQEADRYMQLQDAGADAAMLCKVAGDVVRAFGRDDNQEMKAGWIDVRDKRCNEAEIRKQLPPYR